MHIGMIHLAKRAVATSTPGSFNLSLAYLIVLPSHLIVTGLFAIGFAGAAGLGLGGFEKEPVMSAMDL